MCAYDAARHILLYLQYIRMELDHPFSTVVVMTREELASEVVRWCDLTAPASLSSLLTTFSFS